MGPIEAANPVQSIERADRILTILKERNGARLVELEDEIDLSKGTLHSYLATLHQCGIVTKREMTYHVGFRCLNLGGYVRDREPLFRAGKDGADELAETTGELAALITESNGRCTWLYQAASNDAMPMDSHLGSTLPMHCTASGKALLAELPEERVDGIIEAHGLKSWTDHTITDRGELFEELEEIREQSIAFDDEERIEGLRGIGVPIKRNEKVLGALAMAGPVTRLEGERFWSGLPEQLSKIKRMIEVKATYTRDE